MLRIQRLIFFLLILVCLVRTNERTVCFTDLLAFYDTTSTACQFTKSIFERNFEDSQKTCLVNCTLTTLKPQLREGDWYELEKLEINFLNTFFNFTMMKSCARYYNDDMEMAVTCDVRGLYGNIRQCISLGCHFLLQARGIGESCKKENHCSVSNHYSTCNKRNGVLVCECKNGYFAMFNTCFPEQLSMGETCELNEQCMGHADIGVCRQTERGKECSLLPEIDNMHTSQHTGFQTNSVPNPTEASSADISETTTLRESFQTNNPSNSTTTSSADIPERTPAYSSKEMAKNRDLPVGIIVGAAAAGFISGIIVCGIVCVILSRCKKSTSTNRSAKFAATVDNYGFEVSAISPEKTEHKTVQVSEESSRSDVNRKGGTVPLDDIYNHLHETSGMPGIQPEYDHVPCNDTDDETYHHLNLGNTKNVNTATLVDLENHYN